MQTYVIRRFDKYDNQVTGTYIETNMAGGTVLADATVAAELQHLGLFGRYASLEAYRMVDEFIHSGRVVPSTYQHEDGDRVTLDRV